MAFPFSLHIESRRCLRVTVWGRDDESEIQRKKNDFFWYIFPEEVFTACNISFAWKDKSKNIFKKN